MAKFPVETLKGKNVPGNKDYLLIKKGALICHLGI